MLDPVLALARFTVFLGGAIASGFALFGPQRSNSAVGVGGLLILAGALALLPLEAVSLAGQASAAIDPATLLTVLLKTPVGGSILARSVFAGAILVVLAAHRGGHVPKAAAVPALGALAVGVLGGHAAAGEGGFGLLRLFAGAIHAAAAGLWAGALLAFVACIAQGDALLHAKLRRFSGFGTALVLAVIVTGAFAVRVLTGGLSLAGLTATPWGRLLLVKAAMVALMIALAAFNRHLLSRPGASAGRRLDASIRLEAALGVLVLGLVSFLGLLPPS